MATASDFEAEITRHYRRNFIVNALDTSISGVGFSFMSASSVLPLFVSRLTPSPFIIGLISALTALIWLPQVFTARWIERLPRKKPYVAITTLLGERLGIVVIALSNHFRDDFQRGIGADNQATFVDKLINAFACIQLSTVAAREEIGHLFTF